MNHPTTFNEVIGNRIAINRIKTEIARFNGLGGCVFMLQGATGNGKTMIADILAAMADGDVYRPDCTKDAETGTMLEHIKTLASTSSMFGGISVFIFDECDRLSPDNIAKFKITFDVIDRRRQAGEEVSVMLIFTTAKRKDELTKIQQMHWDEMLSRCALCQIGVTRDELDEHFAKVTGGACGHVSWHIKVQSVRYAWDYVYKNALPVNAVEYDDEPLVVLPESGKPRVEFVQANRVSRNRNGVPKRQQNLIGVIAEILRNHGVMGAARIRAILDETNLYEFKRGVEGYVRTRQITSAIANHLKKYGDSALLQKVADGYVAKQ